MMLLAKSPNLKFSMAIHVFFHVVDLCALRLVRKPFLNAKETLLLCVVGSLLL